MDLAEMQQTVSADMRAAFAAAAPEVVYPDDEFGDAVGCEGGEQQSTIRIMGNNPGGERSNDELLESATGYLSDHGWTITPEYTDSSDRSAKAEKKHVAGGRVYAANGALTFTGETYCKGAADKGKTPRNVQPESIEAAQRDTSEAMRGAFAFAIAGVTFEDDAFGEPVRCLRDSHRTTIRVVGHVPAGMAIDEQQVIDAVGSYLEAREWVLVPATSLFGDQPVLHLSKSSAATGSIVVSGQRTQITFSGDTPCIKD